MSDFPPAWHSSRDLWGGFSLGWSRPDLAEDFPAAPLGRSIPAAAKGEGTTAPILPRQESHPRGWRRAEQGCVPGGRAGGGTQRPKQETRPRNPRLPRERGGKLALGKLRAADLHPPDWDEGESVGRSLSGGGKARSPSRSRTGRAPCPLSCLPETFSVAGAARTEARGPLGQPREGRRSAHAPGLLRQLGGAALSPKTGTALLPGTGAQPFPLRPFLPFLIVPAGLLRSTRRCFADPPFPPSAGIISAPSPRPLRPRAPTLLGLPPGCVSREQKPSSLPTAAGDSTPRSRPAGKQPTGRAGRAAGEGRAGYNPGWLRFRPGRGRAGR